jgi:hypothetical protein
LAAAGSFMHTPRRGLLRGRGAQARAPDSCCCGGFVVAQHTHRYTRAHHATHNSFLGHMQASRRRLAAAQEEKKRRPWSPSTNREWTCPRASTIQYTCPRPPTGNNNNRQQQQPSTRGAEAGVGPAAVRCTGREEEEKFVSLNEQGTDVPASKHEPKHLPAPPDRNNQPPRTTTNDDDRKNMQRYFQGAHANLAHPHQMLDFTSIVTHIWVNPYLD